MTRRSNLLLLFLLVFVGVPYYWLLIDNRPGNVPPRPLAIAELRRLATSLPGPRPVAVAMEQIAYRQVMGNIYAAGIGIRPRRYAELAWRLDVPGEPGIAITPGITPRDAATTPASDPAAQDRSDSALRGADLILTMTAPREAPRPGARSAAEPRAVAAGVVVIPTGVPMSGSRMIYVALEGGQEYLFTGDVAPYGISISETRTRSRLMTDFLRPESRPESFAWLQTVTALNQMEPGLRVIPGHDFEWLRDDVRRRWIQYTITAGTAHSAER